MNLDVSPSRAAAPPRPIGWSLVVLALALAQCSDESGADCQRTYQHLLSVAHRNHTPEAMASFVSACVDHYDPKRLECLREAATPGAALACKPLKKRPD